MANRLIDPRTGEPFPVSVLTEEVAAPRLTSVRHAWGLGVVASNLTPLRLVSLLENAAAGDAHEYLTLAEEMEERDLHYAAVLGTRKRALAGLPVEVHAASDEAADQATADAVRELTDAPEFGDLIDDSLDALGKGYSVSEILWDRSGSRWHPRYVWRDPRWFRFDEESGQELRVLDNDAPTGLALPPFKFVIHTPRVKSGLPIRGGLARLTAAAFLCKALAWKNWHAFVEVFGMPLRLGRHHEGATEEQITTLMRAVANLGTDAAAVIPDTMRIEFPAVVDAAGGAELYRGLVEWWDRQISKGVLGQTMTTDDGSSLGQAKIHNEVRLDILAADARQLANTLARDLVRAFVDLNFGPQTRYPRIVFRLPETEDKQLLVDALARFGGALGVERSVVRDKLGLPDPAPGAELFEHPAGGFALQRRAAQARRARPPAPDYTERARERLATRADRALEEWVEVVQRLVMEVGSLEELRDRLAQLYPDLDPGQFAEAMGDALTAAHMAGRYDILEGL